MYSVAVLYPLPPGVKPTKTKLLGIDNMCEKGTDLHVHVWENNNFYETTSTWFRF